MRQRIDLLANMAKEMQTLFTQLEREAGSMNGDVELQKMSQLVQTLRKLESQSLVAREPLSKGDVELF